MIRIKAEPLKWADEVALKVQHFPPEWLAIWTPGHQVAFHIPTGEIMPMSDERCPIVGTDWSRTRRGRP